MQTVKNRLYPRVRPVFLSRLIAMFAGWKLLVLCFAAYVNTCSEGDCRMHTLQAGGKPKIFVKFSTYAFEGESNNNEASDYSAF